MRLFDHRLHDGSRNFAELPETYDPVTPQWDAIKAHVGALPDAVLTGFITDGVTEAWIDFAYCDHTFMLNNQQGCWWLIVDDPACPDATLAIIYTHFEALLAPRASRARRLGAIAPNSFRVLVSTTSAETHHDFSNLVDAAAYAKDCAWETENGPTYASVFDDHFTAI